MTPWQSVPDKVTALTLKHAAMVRERAAKDDSKPVYIFGEDVGTICVPLKKTAEAPLKPVAEAFDWPGGLMGGPNPLTRTLTGAALGTAAGYGGGWLLGQLFPQKYVDRNRLQRNLSIMGGLLGGGVPAYMFGRTAMADQGLEGWYKQSADDTAVLDAIGQSWHPIDVGLAQLEEDGWSCGDEPLLKAAATAGGAFLPRIPVDHWNQVMWNAPSIPDPVRAASTGLVNAASAAHGGAKLVSPFDVGRIAVGMGSGAASGMLVGKTIGALAGLTPEAQKRIFQAGVGAGLLANVLPMAFGG